MGRRALSWLGPSSASWAMSPISAIGRLAHAGLQQGHTERGDAHDGDLVVSVDGGDKRRGPVTQRDVGEADRGVPAFRAARPTTRVEDLLDPFTAGEHGSSASATCQWPSWWRPSVSGSCSARSTAICAGSSGAATRPTRTVRVGP